MGKESVTAKEVIKSTAAKSEKGTIDLVESKKSKELVLGFCGPAGSGISTVKEKVMKILTESHNYAVIPIKLSEFIKERILAGALEVKAEANDLENAFKRAEKLQDGGDELRDHNSNEILASFAVRKISSEREARGLHLKGARTAYLIDSLKHPSELFLLRAVYGDIFHLFGVLCPEPERTKRLESKDMTETDARKVIERDRDEKGVLHGQKMAKTLQGADFFIRNTDPDMDKLETRIKRFVDLVLGKTTITPTIDEYAMYVAESSAARSGCISRQVGAAIIDRKGNIISTGRNDVPKYGGGLYPGSDGESDNRCFKMYGEFCRNDRYRRETLDSIKIAIKNQGVSEDKCVNVIKEIENTTRIKSLIEFSRSVHAEMDAIVSVARNGSAAIRGCSIYTTTFPCHNCARHIVAAGLDKVYYIEPYEKSLAYSLHDDSIDLEDKHSDGNKRVKFLHYEGVAPSRYLSYFKIQEDRKDNDGRLREYIPAEASPSITENLYSYEDLEAKITEQLEKKGL